MEDEGGAPRHSIQGIPNRPGERGEKERAFLLRSENLRVKKRREAEQKVKPQPLLRG